MLQKLVALIGGVAWLALATPAFADAAPVQRTLCVWDLMGANGDNYALMKDFRINAVQWGVDFKLRAYSEEIRIRARWSCTLYRI